MSERINCCKCGGVFGVSWGDVSTSMCPTCDKAAIKQKAKTMQVKQIIKTKQFTPITLEVTITSRAELENLYARCIASPTTIENGAQVLEVNWDLFNDGEKLDDPLAVTLAKIRRKCNEE